MSSDEEFYLIATNEAEGAERNEALWAKSVALCEGDKEKAKYKYIKLRVEQLKQPQKEPTPPKKPEPTFSKKVVDNFSLQYMPVDEFAKMKGIPEKKVIEMIRDGFYMGQIKEGSWYVSREEITKEDVAAHKNLAPTKQPSKNEYIPVEEFAEYKGMNTEKVIGMIRDGFYVGQIIDDKWYVSFSEVDNTNSMIKGSAELTDWVKWLIYAQIAISIVAIISGMMEFGLLTNFKNSNFTPNAAAIATAESNDSRQGIIGMLQLLVFAVSGIAILKWIYRANYNARELGASNMEFTPGWSIGWYFVPIANLWKPYQAMKEILKASKNPDNWKSESTPSTLPWWWFLWIVTGVVGNASLKLTIRAEEINELLSANIITMLYDAISIPLSLITLAIIKQIYEYQSTQEKSI